MQGSPKTGSQPELASSIDSMDDGAAPSMTYFVRQSLHGRNFIFFLRSQWNRIEIQLEKERDHLALWVPVALGTGIAAWFLAGQLYIWLAIILLCAAIMLGMGLTGLHGRLPRAIFGFAALVVLGLLLMWGRAVFVAQPVLERPVVTVFQAEVERVELLPAREKARLVLKPQNFSDERKLPPRVRVNMPLEKFSDQVEEGAIIELKARLMPPATAALPGAYDFSQRAWFMGLGATGTSLGRIKVIRPSQNSKYLSRLRGRLSEHVQTQMTGGAGAIGATLATGDRGAIAEEDAEAMRRSGLAHLLSISGLHVTAVVGAIYLLFLKSLALSPFLALRWRLPVLAAFAAAVGAISYTLLTGAQVPTVRACVAAILVLAGLVLGRDAITLRLLAAGALFVMLLWPETLLGPSFQLSFAAVISIIALHRYPPIMGFFVRRDEAYGKKVLRFVFALFLTGLVVEMALMPIALFHFHRSGVYGALANIIAIPLTTFFIMPLEAMALIADVFGLGKPFWWLCQIALDMLISLAHFVSSRPGSTTMIPTMGQGTYGLIILSGLWLCLWQRRWRYAGFVGLGLGAILLIFAVPPDIYITGDGRHMAIRNMKGELALLRTRSGFYKGYVVGKRGSG